MLIKAIVVTEFMTNCYVAADDQTREAIVIDPGGDAEKIISELENMDADVVGIVNTHGHVDHIGAIKELKARYKVDVMLHKDDLPVFKSASKMGRLFGLNVENQPEPDRYIAEGDEIRAGSLKFRVIETPGHSPGGICLVSEDGKHCFGGDTIFAGSIGRTDLPGGDYDTLISSIKDKLMKLADEAKVYTGHGPATTIGMERKHNPFL